MHYNSEIIGDVRNSNLFKLMTQIKKQFSITDTIGVGGFPFWKIWGGMAGKNSMAKLAKNHVKWQVETSR